MKKNLLLLKLTAIFLFVLQYGFAGNPLDHLIHTWTGASSTDWNSPANWEPLFVPSSADSVIIPANMPHDPVLVACNAVVCRTMTVEAEGLKSTNSSRAGITISGGEVVIDGNLTIKAGAKMTIDYDGALTVNGNTKIGSAGGLEIESGGSLITNGSITGSAIVKRIIPDDLSWHLLSSPVGYQEICDGVFAPTPANFGTTAVTTWDFYKWMTNCPTPPFPPERWRNLRNPDVTINTVDYGTVPAFEVTKGYLVAYGSGFPTTKVFAGVPNTGDKNYSFFEVTSECSWELAGNPYPSAFSWNQVTSKENLANGYYYIWNEAKSGGPGYEAFLDESHKTTGVNGNIPSMQGFFIKIDPTKSKQLDVPNTSRVHDVDLWLKNQEGISLNKLQITFGNGTNFDESIILFGSGCELGKDWYDAEKMFGIDNTIPQVYTLVDNDQKTVINSLPYTSSSLTVPIGFVAPSEGNYSMTFSGIECFGSLTGLFLEDLQENINHNLLLDNTYRFRAQGNEDAGRFLLHFSGTIGVAEKSNSAIHVYANQNTVFVTCADGFQNSRITICNLLGQEIVRQKLGDQAINQIRVNAPTGYYIVKVQNETTVKTSKIYIN